MRKVEMALSGLFILGAAGHFFDINFFGGDLGAVVALLSGFLLTLLYLLGGVLLFNDIPWLKVFDRSAYDATNVYRIVWSIFAGWLFAQAVLSLLFAVNGWVGTEQMFLTGAFCVVGVLIAGLIFWLIKRGLFHLRIVGRALIFLVAYFVIFRLAGQF